MRDTTMALLQQASARSGDLADVRYRLTSALDKEGHLFDAATVTSCRDWDELANTAGNILSGLA